MAEKLMKIGGLSSEGTAKPFNVELQERIILDNVSILSNSNKTVTFDSKKPYRIFVRKHNNFDKSWSLTHTAIINEITLGAMTSKTILKSDGTNLLIGYGARGEGVTDVITPYSKKTSLELQNSSDSDCLFSIIIVEYPFSVQNLNSQANKKNKKNSIYISQSGSVPTGEKIIFENKINTKIEYLEWSTDYVNTFIYIEFYKNGVYTPIGGIMKSGNQVSGFTPALTISQCHGLFDVLSYEDGNYKFAINREMNFPEGLRIRVSHSNTTSANIALRAYGVEEND